MSKITLTILGTTAGVPTRDRAHTAIHLSHDDGEEHCYLFDCGENAQRQMLLAGLNILKLEGVFITHWHGDHCLGLPGLVDTMGFEGRSAPLAVFAPESARIRKSLAFSRTMGKLKVVPRDVRARGGSISTVMETPRFSIVSVPVKHGVPAVAYALVEKDKLRIDTEKALALGLPEKGEIYRELKEKGKVLTGGRRVAIEEVSVVEKGKKVVFSGDTEICDNLRGLARGADLLVQDCTYFESRDDKPHQHASLPEILEMTAAGKVKRTVLTHISRKHQDAGELRKMVEARADIVVAEDFLRVTV